VSVTCDTGQMVVLMSKYTGNVRESAQSKGMVGGSRFIGTGSREWVMKVKIHECSMRSWIKDSGWWVLQKNIYVWAAQENRRITDK
jgi:hypothetical protein